MFVSGREAGGLEPFARAACIWNKSQGRCRGPALLGLSQSGGLEQWGAGNWGKEPNRSFQIIIITFY